MSEETKFPKLRKFILQAPGDKPGEPQPLEYTNYEMNPPVTYRIVPGDDQKWHWEILQCGWTIRKCPEGQGYSDNMEAYQALKEVVQKSLAS
jgi:hypothetical protein